MGEMTFVDLLVVGGGPAGLSAATAFREHGGTGDVLLVSADPALPYDRPPLSKTYLRGDSGEADLPMQPATFYRDQRIATHLGTEVLALDPARSTATLTGGSTVHYRRCVLATGADPAPMPVPGADHPDVRLLRSLISARALVGRAAAARSPVVLGSGFIGCEAAASLAARGLAVTLVTDEAQPQRARLGDAVGKRIAAWLADAGVTLILGSPVRRIERGRVVHPADGPPIEADLVLMAGGVRPHGRLAEDAGLAVADGRVVADEHMRTSAPNVFAAGDVAYAHNASAGRPLRVEHWGEALIMGEIAGTVAAGGEAAWTDAPGFWSTVGERTIKYAAWGDGFDHVRFIEHDDGSFTAWYGRDGVTVGVLTFEADEDYEAGRAAVQRARPFAS
jgi:NADPH-dependent 2,4-dienoyl-CoA reductase/sulfur reductase-like enzyme